MARYIRRIAGRNAAATTEVAVEDVAREQNEFVQLNFPADGEEWIGRLNGAEHAGVYWTVDRQDNTGVRAAAVGDAAAVDDTIQLVGASSGGTEGGRTESPRCTALRRLSRAIRPARRCRGLGLAATLGITNLQTQPAIFIGNEPFTVIGIIADVERKADLLPSVVVPRSAALRMWGEPRDAGGPDAHLRQDVLLVDLATVNGQ